MKKDSKIDIECQFASMRTNLPDQAILHHWAVTTLGQHCQQATICIRIIDESESAQLNHRYRHKKGPTNVLAFCYQREPLMGDLAICAPVVFHEADAAGICAQSHWAHMVVHGTLHLLGYDHHSDDEATIMAQQESKIMLQLGYNDPYL